MDKEVHDLIKYLALLEVEIQNSRSLYHSKKEKLKNKIQALSDIYHEEQSIKFDDMNRNIDKLVMVTSKMQKEG